MKKILLSTAAAAVLFVLYCAGAAVLGNRAAAQQPPMSQGMQAPMPSIALVDINYIFKHHARLKAELEALSKEGAAVQKQFEDESRALQSQAEQLKTIKPESPDYQRIEENLVNQRSLMQGRVALKRKEFVQREAKLYYNAYLEISGETQHWCQQLGFAMAMNFNGDAIDPDQPDTVARGISQRVIYYNKSQDITPRVMQRFIGGNGAAQNDQGVTPSPYNSPSLMGNYAGAQQPRMQ